MCCNVFSHLMRDMVTSALNLLQPQKFVNARERLHLVEGPNNPFDLRSRPIGEADAADGTALNSKKVKCWELIFVEG